MRQLILCCLFILFAGFKQGIPGITMKLADASVVSEQQEITISTGMVEGKWRWTGKGLVTTGFKNIATGTEWVSNDFSKMADWSLGLPGMDKANLLSLEAVESDDTKFTSKHIAIEATIDYPDANIELRYVIWAYPNAPGLRTQLLIKGKNGYTPDTLFNGDLANTDHLPVDVKGLKFQTVGFYNDHDGRNADSLQMVDVIHFGDPAPTDSFPLANILFAYNEKEGVGLVKESQKVVNEPSVNTGIFYYNREGIYTTGCGLSAKDIVPDKFRPCWAVWRLAWSGNEDDKQLALKMFDRKRYPKINQHDVFIMTNVWGGGKSQASASEENILKEINSASDLGIDVVQIDAGWGPETGAPKTWEPAKAVYPHGWSTIMDLAHQKGVTMGIWNKAYDLIEHPDRLRGQYDAGFRYFKIDIAAWNTYNIIDSLTFLARDLVKYSNYTARVNWDITHKFIRVGYFYAREYGNLFLQNRRLKRDSDKNPSSHMYVPRRILKDQWMACQYLNLNEILINVQNTDLVLKEFSNAHLYGNVYSFAIAMMSSPLFFQETWRYLPEVREPLRNLIAIYTDHRNEMYEGYVFPIGELPNDASWTGFQNYNPRTNSGYLTIFREINSQECEKSIQLKFVKGKSIELENLLTGEKQAVQLDPNGALPLLIAKPASFLFYKYNAY